MRIKFSNKEKDLLIKMFIHGLTCGLNHPIEFYLDYLRFSEFVKDPIKFEDKVTKVFLKLINASRLPEETPIDTTEDLNQYIDQYYKNFQKK